MSWNRFIKALCEDKANAMVFGHRSRFEGPAQHAYIKYGKGLRALHNGIAKHLPAAIEKAKAQKNASLVAQLEKQGYTVTKNG